MKSVSKMFKQINIKLLSWALETYCNRHMPENWHHISVGNQCSAKVKKVLNNYADLGGKYSNTVLYRVFHEVSQFDLRSIVFIKRSVK